VKGEYFFSMIDLAANSIVQEPVGYEQATVHKQPFGVLKLGRFSLAHGDNLVNAMI
jgi:hypothetical protein